MKLKSIFLTAVTTLSLATATIAQVPNYVPTNGLVGWWPFNGNANDESGNGNNGIVNGSALTTDRFGITNSAFNFNGTSDYIEIFDDNSLDLTNQYTFSIWVKIPDYSLNTNQNAPQRTMLGKPRTQSGSGYSFRAIEGLDFGTGNSLAYNSSWNTTGPVVNGGLYSIDTLNINTWTNLVFTYDGSNANLFENGVLVNSMSVTFSLINSTQSLFFGKEFLNNDNSLNRWFKGTLDDIGIWNRALTQQEINDLYDAVNCANSTSITPQINSINTGNLATFTASTTDSNPSYVWQSDFGQGFQTLNDFGNYSGVSSSALNISNVQLANHNQQIRVISTSGDCMDTSNVATINILDTCIITVYDTLLTTVTDTLVINTQITGINPPNNVNTLKVFPNPASTHITIDYGNFNSMSGYTLTIVNSIGQTVYTTSINQQTSYIDLSTWSGSGIYFVQLIDPQNNTIENRKIIIQ